MWHTDPRAWSPDEGGLGYPLVGHLRESQCCMEGVSGAGPLGHVTCLQWRRVTFLVDVDVPLPLQSSQCCVDEQLPEPWVLKHASGGGEGRGGEGRRGSGSTGN